VKTAAFVLVFASIPCLVRAQDIDPLQISAIVREPGGNGLPLPAIRQHLPKVGNSSMPDLVLRAAIIGALWMALSVP
jgi:hypothetical protein